MELKLISKENNEAKFEMNFSKEEFEDAQIEAYKKNKFKFNIPGFRKGKAPKSIVEKHYGEGIFFEEAINSMFNEKYPKALAELDLEVAGSPRAEFSKLEKGKNLDITITVAIEPEVEVKDYKGIEVKKIVKKVKEEDVKKELEALQKRNARIVSVKRAAKNGDTLILDFEGKIGDKKFDGGTAEKQQLKLGSGMFIPGFEDQLVGVKPGDEKDVIVTFPENYQAKDLAGKEATFHCKVHEIKEEQLPELDDEFAKDISEFDTMKEYKESVKKKLQKFADESAKQEMQSKIVEKICDKTKIDIPTEMLDNEKNKMAQELSQQLQYQGIGLEQYLQMTNSNMKKFLDELEPEAIKRIKTRLVLNSIVAAEKIKVNDSDVNKQLTEMGMQYGMDAEQVKKALGEDNLRYIVKDAKTKKAVEMLLDNAVIK